MKIVYALLIVITSISCQREYGCTCRAVSQDKDTLVDHIKTTKLGSKGYRKTCANFETRNLNLVNCQVK